MPDLISIVVPVGRVDAPLREQIEALENQEDAGAFEVILSHNTDNSAERRELEAIASAFQAGHARVVDSSGTGGASHARNVGAREAKGQYILFCDGDDIVAPGWIYAMSKALENHQVVSGHLDERLLAVPGQEDWRPPATPDALPTFLGYPYLLAGNMGIARSVFESVGGFDETLIRGEDMAISFRLIDLEIPLGYARDAVVHYRHRRGLWPMLKQHYLYGKGMSQIIMRGGLPKSASIGRSMLRANNQSVASRSPVHWCRRGAIAAGRLAGIVSEKLGARRSAPG